MSNYQNNLLLQAANGEKTERTPVWMMRQAGRILTEYKAVRKHFPSFVEFVKHPEAAAEVTVQPVDILGVDAAIIFSDILVIPEAMGLPYEMVEKKGPVFPTTIKSGADIDRLTIADPVGDLGYVTDAIKLAKELLADRVPLIGFAGAPFTIFCYMIEGSGSKTFSEARKFLYCFPEQSHKLLDKITQSTITYLKAQIEAGADLVQVFDSWAGILPQSQYAAFAAPYIRQICDAIGEVPVTVFAKGAPLALDEFASFSCQTVGLDWNMDIEHAKKTLPGKTLQGNFDPCALYVSPKEITKMVHQMLSEFGDHSHIANLGHGLYPDTPRENAIAFVEAVKSFQA